MIVKRIDPLSAGKVAGILYGAMGLIFGLIFGVMSLVGAGIGTAAGESGAMFGALFGIGAMVLFPILYGGLAYVSMALGALLYNLIARYVGGVKIDLEEEGSGA